MITGFYLYSLYAMTGIFTVCGITGLINEKNNK